MGSPSPLQRGSKIRQEAAQASRSGTITPQNATVWSEASKHRAGERLQHARPINGSVVEPPVSGGGSGGRGKGVQPGATEEAACCEYAGRRTHGARRRRRRLERRLVERSVEAELDCLWRKGSFLPVFFCCSNSFLKKFLLYFLAIQRKTLHHSASHLSCGR